MISSLAISFQAIICLNMSDIAVRREDNLCIKYVDIKNKR
jgi:hypothetical protein